jgi:hypothetical protein
MTDRFDEPPGVDELDIELRTAHDVAVRMVCIGAVCRRAFLESGEDTAALDERQAERFDLAAWLQHEGLAGAVSPNEWETIQTPVGRLGADVAACLSWQSEAFVALAWALGLLDSMPGYPTTAEPGPLFELIPSPWDESRGFTSQARLRDETTIARERERAELWAWRAEMDEILASGDATTVDETIAAIGEVAREAHRAGLLPAPVARDFAVSESSYRELPGATRADAVSVTEHRLRALNWVCGFGVSWDDVPLDP